MFSSLSVTQKSGIIVCTVLAGLILAVTNGWSPKTDAERGTEAQRAQPEIATVNVAIAQSGTLQETLEYTGTTQPFREVSLRSQVQAELLDLTVDVGDRVVRGQTLAQLNNTIQTTTVVQAQSEVAALQGEVAEAQALVSDARTQVNRARAELQQAQADAKRLQFLSRQGAIPVQQAEQAQTTFRTAQATLRSALEQVRTRQQQVASAQQRVKGQQAIVAREQQQQSLTRLTSPVTGSVLERTSEPGNVLQPGGEVLRLGDFSQLKVAVQVSELELGSIRPGQTVQVRLDAFPNQTFTGRVSRISPAADPIARLVPIEVTLPNVTQQLGSGLLARVAFNQRSNRSRVLVSEAALQVNQPRRGGQPSSGANPESGGGSSSQSGNNQQRGTSGTNNLPRDIGTIFVVAESGAQPKVTARSVTLGRRGDGRVEILSGLQSGDRYVVRSSGALKNGDAVRPSILSEPEKSTAKPGET
jgi:HlyD family secretion protein